MRHARRPGHRRSAAESRRSGRETRPTRRENAPRRNRARFCPPPARWNDKHARLLGRHTRLCILLARSHLFRLLSSPLISISSPSHLPGPSPRTSCRRARTHARTRHAAQFTRTRMPGRQHACVRAAADAEKYLRRAVSLCSRALR